MGRSVFLNGRVFDGTRVLDPGTSVVVEGNRITHVGKAPVETGETDAVYDLAGRTLMPGMVQCHFHSGFGPDAGNPSPYLGQGMPAAYLGMVAAKNAQIAVEFGVTSIIGSSNGDLLDVCLKEAILLGQTVGPRVIPCTPELMTSGDAADGDNRSWYMGITHKGLTRRVDGVDQMRQVVREEVGRGAQIVKLAVSDGHGSQIIPDWNHMSEGEIRAAVEEAHHRRAMVRAHSPTREGVIQCAKAGVDIIDHADLIDEEGIELVVKAGASITPSYLWSVRFAAFADSWDYANGPFPIGNGFPESHEQGLARLAGVKAQFEYTVSMLPKMRAAGVNLVLGDDYGFAMMPHGDYASEMQVYVDHGVPPIEVMQWATRNGARAMGRHGEELGEIIEGRLADLIVVDGNPTEDVLVFRDPSNVQLVLKDGSVLKDGLAGA
jgi:imidazolonepropionase-like amidohydrolase